MRKQVILRLDEGLVGRVDAARGVLGQSRQVWLERAVHAALDGEPVRSPEVVAALREVWDDPRLLEQFVEQMPTIEPSHTVVPSLDVGLAPVRREGESIVAFRIRKADYVREQMKLSSQIDNS